jgi:hypothetical protein
VSVPSDRSQGNGYEPRFDADYAYGRQGELLVADLLGQLGAGQASYEVKRERYANARFYVEEYQNPRGRGWKPSGINVTTAEYWVFVKPGGFVIWVPVVELRRLLDAGKGLAREERDGDNPTRGRLVYINSLLDRPPARADGSDAVPRLF